MKQQKKILVTSALPYVNNLPHLGNIIGCVLSADVFARFARLQGHKVLYVCGADEHGTATEAKAKEEGLTPKELCDKYYALHKNIYDWFDISFDIFGRTSQPNHISITQDIFRLVHKHGYIEQDIVTQPFCTTCNTFLADRFIEGTCPYCGYEEARGDQCDACGKLLNPTELQHPRCKTDRTTPEFKQTEHLFLDLGKLQKHLETWVAKQSKAGKWTQNAIRTTQAWFKEGLKRRAITRDLSWGVPVPDDLFDGRFKDKVFYVWFDAPIGYLSITQQLLGEQWKDWWQNKDVKLYQFMGKDNIPFHSIIFPGTLLAADNVKLVGDTLTEGTFTLVHHLSVTEYLNYEHDKFSKSRGVGVFGDNAKDSGIPSDVFRYVLLYNRPESADTQFTWKGLQERLNNELVANFGNLVNRAVSFTNKFLDSSLPALAHGDLDEVQKRFYEQFLEEANHYIVLLEEVRLREALVHFMKLSTRANQFFQEREPWKTKTSNRNQCQKDLALLAHIVKDLAILISPYLPDTSKRIFEQLAISPRKLDDVGKLSIAHHTLAKAQILFEKIDDERVEELRRHYGGVQDADVVHNAEQTREKPQTSDAGQLDLRVGKITHVVKHPKADKLYIETVDVGDKQIEIVSGLVPYYTAEELQGKHIVVVANLKPAKLRGVMSHGMLLAAEDDNETVGLILAPKLSPGTRLDTGKDKPKPELTFEEFMTFTFLAKDGCVLLNGKKLDNLLIDRITNGVIR